MSFAEYELNIETMVSYHISNLYELEGSWLPQFTDDPLEIDLTRIKYTKARRKELNKWKRQKLLLKYLK